MTGYVYQPIASKYSFSPVVPSDSSVIALSSRPVPQAVSAPVAALIPATPTRSYLVPALSNLLSIPTHTYLPTIRSEIPGREEANSFRNSNKVTRGNPFANNREKRRKKLIKTYRANSLYSGASQRISDNENNNTRMLYTALQLKNIGRNSLGQQNTVNGNFGEQRYARPSFRTRSNDNSVSVSGNANEQRRTIPAFLTTSYDRSAAVNTKFGGQKDVKPALRFPSSEDSATLNGPSGTQRKIGPALRTLPYGYSGTNNRNSVIQQNARPAFHSSLYGDSAAVTKFYSAQEKPDSGYPYQIAPSGEYFGILAQERGLYVRLLYMVLVSLKHQLLLCIGKPLCTLRFFSKYSKVYKSNW